MHLGAPVTLSEPHDWISSGRRGGSPLHVEQFWCDEAVASLPNIFLITQLPIPDRYVHEPHLQSAWPRPSELGMPRDRRRHHCAVGKSFRSQHIAKQCSVVGVISG